MGKSHRHKKLNRQEKAKTQLKGAKKLAKAANVVNPTLRVKRIVIREQLHSSTASTTTTPIEGGSGGNVNIALTRRHQTLPELLSALHHHNTNLRKDALLGLHELVTGVHNRNTTFLKGNLDKILERVAALTSDLEGIVRKENLKVAEAIFSRVTEAEMVPFWPLLLTHLACTLTHLRPSVRVSTLPFFHLLVSYFPNLVADSARSLLTSFLALISSSDPSSTTSHSSQLKVEISGQKDQVLERLKVFALIDATLQLRMRKGLVKGQDGAVPRHIKFQEDEVMDLSSSPDKQNNEIAIFSLSLGQKTKKKANEEEETGLIYPFGYDSLNSSTRNYSSPSLGEILGVGFSSSTSTTTSDDETQFWSRFSTSCLSCLIQTWIESCPVASGSSMALGVLASKSTASPQESTRANVNKTKKRGSGDKKVDSLAKSLSSQQPPSLAPQPQSAGTGTSVNLNPASVDTLRSLVNVMVQIINPLTPGQSEDGKSTASVKLLKAIRESRGSELRKHFFSHLPYVSIQESQKQGLTTINLELFLLAAHLGLMDEDLMTRLETLIHELISGGSLDSTQCELILRFLSCGDPFLGMEKAAGGGAGGAGGKKRVQRQKDEQTERNRSLSTDFMIAVLSSKEHRREICKYLGKVLRPENTNLEEMFLVQSLDWGRVTSKLVFAFSRISLKWLNLLTHIAIRRLDSGGIKSHLLQRMEWFQVQLEESTSSEMWIESIRLFWYSGALSEFKIVFRDKLAAINNKIVSDMLSSLEECHSMSEESLSEVDIDIEMSR